MLQSRITVISGECDTPVPILQLISLIGGLIKSDHTHSGIPPPHVLYAAMDFGTVTHGFYTDFELVTTSLGWSSQLSSRTQRFELYSRPRKALSCLSLIYDQSLGLEGTPTLQV